MIPPGCEPRCPACAHRGLSARESESRKSEWLHRALAPWKDAIEPLRAPSEERRFNYRDRTLLHAVRLGERWEFGMKRVGRGRFEADEIVPIPGCPVHTQRVRVALSALSEGLCGEALLKIDLRFVVIAGSLMTWVVKESPESHLARSGVLAEGAEKLGPELRAAGVEGIFANFNPVAGRRVFSVRGWKHLWGATRSSDEFPRGPQSFQQLISELYENALDEAATWLSPASGDLVMDLYSGAGRSIQKWESMGAESVGVELVGGLSSALSDRIFRGRVSERVPQLESRRTSWRAKNPGGRVLVFANPPRTGLDPDTVEHLGAVRIAYLSCSAGTLARDLSKLENCAYRVRRIIPYDFFPQTSHVETLALLDLDPSVRVRDPLAGERLRRAE